MYRPTHFDRRYLVIENMNKKIPMLNHSSSFRKLPVKFQIPTINNS